MALEKRKHSRDIPTLLKFSDADLKANRQGVLSRGQSMRLLGSFLFEIFTYLAMACLVAYSIAGGIIVLVILPPMSTDAFNILFGGCVLFAGSLVIGMAYLLLRTVWTFGSDLIERRAHQVTGPLRKITKSDASTCLIIDKQTISVKKAVYHSLMEGSVYGLYYTPKTHRLLSIELIEDRAHEAPDLSDS